MLTSEWRIYIYIWISKIGYHCFRSWLVTFLVSSQYKNQCWLCVNLNKWEQISLKFESKYSNFHEENIHETECLNAVCKKAVILFRPHMLTNCMWSDSKWVHLFSRSTSSHWGQDKMAAILQTIISNASWVKMYEFWLKFHWSLFWKVQSTTFQHWFK